MSTHIIAQQQKNKKQAQGKLSDSYRTPPWLFKWLNEKFEFQFDVCASDENRLCDKYYTEENPYSGRNWSEFGFMGFCNPPFSHGQKEAALANAYRNMIEHDVSTVFLIPSDISNGFWLSHIIGKATKITAIVGRVKFYDPTTNEESKQGLGCAVVEFIAGSEPTYIVNEFIKRDDIKKQYL